MKENELINLDDARGVMEFLQQSTVNIAEFLTGILASDKKDWKLSGARLVQSVIKVKFLTQFGRELKKYRDAGKIKEDYFATNKNQASLYELLKFLDEEIPDEELFVAVKSIFFTGVTKDASQGDEFLAYEFLQTAKKLSGTEILILKANFAIAQNRILPSLAGINQSEQSRNAWANTVAAQMGYEGLGAMVFKYEDNLMASGLIAPIHSNANLKDMFVQTQKFRLSQMGYQFCEFITKYQ